jgi:hypothetical protein
MDFGEKGWQGVGWINLVRDRDQWWDVVNAVLLNLRDSQWWEFHD